MRRLLIIFVLPVILMVACSTGGKLVKLSDQGTEAFNSGNFEKALQAWEPVIADYEANSKEAECPVYGKAGQAALRLKQYDKGTGYIELASYYKTAGPDDLEALANEYKRIDNLSKELDVLETFNERFPDDDGIGRIQNRLFELYIESENWEQAIRMWTNLSEEAKGLLGNMEGYFTANLKMGNEEVCDDFAERILTVQPENIPSLEFKAKKYYNMAENRYQDEMAAYEKNKTNKQYNILIKAFETVTKDFKTSLGYFRQLYEIEPGPKYAKFLANIYARLDDKKKADYYKSKSQ